MIEAPPDRGEGKRAGLALGVLFLGTFVMGSAELLAVGVLNLMARDLRVSDAAAGILVTAYAAGLAVGGPLLAAATARAGRRRVLLAALAVYAAVTATAFGAGSFPVLLAARVLTGSVQGLFVGAAFTVATSIVPPQRAGRAISAVVGGFAVSAAIGVPAGALIGQHLGWRGAFLAVAALGALVLPCTWAVVPPVTAAPPGGPAAGVRKAFSPRVLAMLAFAVAVFAGSYGALTYITPYLQQVTGLPEAWITAFLLIYGAATACGAFGGGRFADRSAPRTLVAATAVLVVSLAALAAAGRLPAVAAVALAAWGLAGFGLVPSLQYRVVSLAGPAAAAVAATLPASAINAGIAAGSLLGGWALAAHGPSAPVYTGIAACAAALVLAVATARLRPSGTPDRRRDAGSGLDPGSGLAEPPVAASAEACEP